MPPWIFIYAVVSLYLSQQWIQTWRTQPEQTVVVTAVMILTSYFAYRAFIHDKAENALTAVLPDTTPMHFLLQQNKRLVKAMTKFTRKYKWIDPGAHSECIMYLSKFLRVYSRLLLKAPDNVILQDVNDLIEIRRALLNCLYSFNIKNSTLVHDQVFRDIVLTVHASTYRYLEILRNKHQHMAPTLPPMPQAFDPRPTTTYDML